MSSASSVRRFCFAHPVGVSRLVVWSLLCVVAPRMSAQTVRDSAGIRIVENPALADSPVRFRLGTQPTLDVGGLDAEPELEFNAQRGELWAVPLRNGGLAVLDITRVQLFSRTGARVRVIGRAGGGPDEFRALYSGCGLAAIRWLSPMGSCRAS